MAMKKTLGQALKRAREALGLTQRQLASQAGVKASHVAFLESDRRRPSLGLLSRLAEVLGLEQDKLILLAQPEASSLLGGRPRVAPRGQAWREFVNNKALLARHNVQPAELEVLAQANLLGRVIAPRDFLFILNSIRQAADTEQL
jgi:transcriptional regulator with XRE-family HTH domain